MWQIFLAAGVVFAFLGVAELKKEKYGNNPFQMRGIRSEKLRESFEKIYGFLKKKEKNKEVMLPEVNVQGSKYSFRPLNTEDKREERRVQYIKLRLAEEDDLKRKQEQARQRLKLLQNMENEARMREERDKFEQMKRENIEREKQRRWKEHYIVKAVRERFNKEQKDEGGGKEDGENLKGVFASLLSQREQVENEVGNKKGEEGEKVLGGGGMLQPSQPYSFLPSTSLPSTSSSLSVAEEEKGGFKEGENSGLPSSTLVEKTVSNGIEDEIKKVEGVNSSEEGSTGEKEGKEDILSFFTNRARENKKEFDPSEMFKGI